MCGYGYGNKTVLISVLFFQIILAIAAIGHAAPAADPYYLGFGLSAGLVGAPVVSGYAVAPRVVAAPVVAAAAPVVTVSHHVVHQPIATHRYTVPVSTKTETIHLDPIVRTYTLPHVLGGHPLVVAAAAEKAPEAEAEGIIEA